MLFRIFSRKIHKRNMNFQIFFDDTHRLSCRSIQARVCVMACAVAGIIDNVSGYHNKHHCVTMEIIIAGFMCYR